MSVWYLNQICLMAFGPFHGVISTFGFLKSGYCSKFQPWSFNQKPHGILNLSWELTCPPHPALTQCSVKSWRVVFWNSGLNLMVLSDVFFTIWDGPFLSLLQTPLGNHSKDSANSPVPVRVADNFCMVSPLSVTYFSLLLLDQFYSNQLFIHQICFLLCTCACDCVTGWRVNWIKAVEVLNSWNHGPE
jgi:hypothetical protein